MCVCVVSGAWVPFFRYGSLGFCLLIDYQIANETCQRQFEQHPSKEVAGATTSNNGNKTVQFGFYFAHFTIYRFPFPRFPRFSQFFTLLKKKTRHRMSLYNQNIQINHSIALVLHILCTRRVSVWECACVCVCDRHMRCAYGVLAYIHLNKILLSINQQKVQGVLVMNTVKVHFMQRCFPPSPTTNVSQTERTRLIRSLSLC